MVRKYCNKWQRNDDFEQKNDKAREVHVFSPVGKEGERVTFTFSRLLGWYTMHLEKLSYGTSSLMTGSLVLFISLCTSTPVRFACKNKNNFIKLLWLKRKSKSSIVVTRIYFLLSNNLPLCCLLHYLKYVTHFTTYLDGRFVAVFPLFSVCDIFFKTYQGNCNRRSFSHCWA